MAKRSTFFGPIRYFLILLCVLIALPMTALAFDEFKYDLRLVRELTEVGMTDYAALQVQRMYSKYSDRDNEIAFAQARVYQATNQQSKANQILQQIPASSPLYAEARLLLGQNAFRRGRFDYAREVFNEFFEAQPRPISSTKQDVRDFITAVQMYAQVFIQLGQAQKVGTALEYLSAVGETGSISAQEISYLKASAALSAYDLLEEKNQPLDKKHIQQIIQELEDLQFSTDMMVVINATLESAHADLLLKQYIPAIKKIRTLDKPLSRVAEEIPSRVSPLATAYFYEGRALKGLGEKALESENPQRAAKLLQAAAKRFQRIRKNFERHRLNENAVVEYSKIRKQLSEELNINLPGGDGLDGEVIVQLRQANNLFQNKQYQRAIDPYQKALQKGRLSGRAPELGLRLAYSYAQTDQFLKAQAIGSYLRDVFPESRDTAETLLQLGNFLYREAQNMEEGSDKEERLDQAMAIWEEFVEVGSRHPKAPDIAFVIAENQYRKARNVASQADKASGVARKEELKEEARRLYREALPLYERILKEFATTIRGIRTYYKLGWIHHALEQNQLAAEAFLKYYALETNPDNAEDRMLAKFHAAHQLMSSTEPRAAIEHFQEFIEIIENDEQATGLTTADADLQKLLVDAQSYLAWTYDLAAEQLRPRVTEIDEEIESYEAIVEKHEAQIQTLQEEKDRAEKLMAEAREQFEAQQETLETPIPSPEEQARKQFRERLDEAVTDEEKAAVMREYVEPQIPKNRGNILADLRGRKTEFEELRTTVQKSYEDNRKQLEEMAETITQAERDVLALEEELSLVKDKLETRRNELQNFEQKEQDLQEEIESWRSQIEEARKAFEAGDEEAKKQALADRKAALAQINRVSLQLNDVRARLQELRSPEMSQALQNLDQRHDTILVQLEKTKNRLKELKKDKAVLAQDIDVQNARKRAVAQQIKRLELQIELTKTPEDERRQTAEEQGWDDQIQETLKALEELKDARLARNQVLQDVTEAGIKEAKQNIADARTAIARLEKKKKPITAEIQKLKKQAQKRFIAFNRKFPDSSHVPSNLARLGTNYMELGDNAKAEQYLNELAEKYPEDDALEKALFTLGKAQFETGQMEEAVSTFERILTNKREQSLGSLSYILRKTLANGFPKLALEAGEELLRRSNDKTHEDYERLAGKSRENLLFRVGKAAFLSDKNRQAVKNLTELLEVNETTARYYEAKMLLGQAKRDMTPPDLEGSRNDFLDIIQFSQDPVVENQAIIEVAKTYFKMATEKGVKMAMGQIGQFAFVSDNEVVVMVNEEEPDNIPLLEEALYLGAKGSALLGRTDARDLFVEKYRKRFPGGRFSEELENLPAAKYSQTLDTPETEDGDTE